MQDELRNGNRFRLFDVRARASSRGSWDGGRPIAAGSKGDPFAGTNHQVAWAPVNDPHDMGMVQSKYDTDSRRAVKKFAHTPALSPPAALDATQRIIHGNVVQLPPIRDIISTSLVLKAQQQCTSA